MKLGIHVALATILLTFGITTQAQNLGIAVIERTQGFTALQRDGSWQFAAEGDHIQAGDQLYSGDASRMEFEFADGTNATLSEFTRFSVDEYQWSESLEEPSAEFTLNQGAFRIVTGLITQVSSPRFAVNTPNASIGIRGTDFWGGYLDPGLIDVLFVAGEHSIEISNSLGTAVLTTPGEGVTVADAQAPGEVRVWGQAKVDRAVATITFD